MTGRRLNERDPVDLLGRESALSTPTLAEYRPSDRSSPRHARLDSIPSVGVEVAAGADADAASREFPRTLVVSGHLAPSRGGVESFTEQIARRLPADRITVMAPAQPGSEAVDRSLPFEVIRYQGRLATRPQLAGQIARQAQALGAEAAWITSAMPLGAVARRLRRHGVERIVVSTHGMEIGWARIPVVRRVLARAARHADVVTYLGDYTGARIAPLLGPRTTALQLTGGVDTERFRPSADVEAIRERLGYTNYQLVVSASRLVRRKGQDKLIAAWPAILATHPRARLLIVGDGPRRDYLQRLARSVGVERWVQFTGAATDRELAGYLACGDVFALPCRDVWGGLQVEGLGLSILEASACGTPVVVGASGGSPDSVIDGVTGALVDGRSRHDIGTAICNLLSDPARGRKMGEAGRSWVDERWGWAPLAAQLSQALSATPATVAAR